jgi:hypothetical protein
MASSTLHAVAVLTHSRAKPGHSEVDHHNKCLARIP